MKWKLEALWQDFCVTNIRGKQQERGDEERGIFLYRTLVLTKGGERTKNDEYFKFKGLRINLSLTEKT